MTTSAKVVQTTSLHEQPLVGLPSPERSHFMTNCLLTIIGLVSKTERLQTHVLNDLITVDLTDTAKNTKLLLTVPPSRTSHEICCEVALLAGCHPTT